MAVAPPESAVVYHISVVVLFVALPVDEIALVHVAPVCVMLVMVFVDVLCVEITAISVLPFVGLVGNVALNEVEALVPVFDVVFCIRVWA